MQNQNQNQTQNQNSTTQAKDIITINNHNLKIIEFKNERIVSFDDIDHLHDRPTGTARRNFNANKSRFSHNKHYFCFKKRGFNEIRTHTPKKCNALEIEPEKCHEVSAEMWEKMGFNQKAFTANMITEKGYLLLVKSFTDDLSWQIQEQLIDGYFRAKKPSPTNTIPGYQAIYQQAIDLADPDIAHAAHVEIMKALDRKVKKPRRKNAKPHQSYTLGMTPADHFLETAKEMVLTGYIKDPSEYVGRSPSTRKIAIWFRGLFDQYERYCRDIGIIASDAKDTRTILSSSDHKGTQKPFRINGLTKRSIVFDDDQAPQPLKDILNHIYAPNQSTKG